MIHQSPSEIDITRYEINQRVIWWIFDKLDYPFFFCVLIDVEYGINCPPTGYGLGAKSTRIQYRRVTVKLPNGH